MKTIAFVDRYDGNRILRKYNVENTKPIKRIKEALKELQHVGNIDIYLCKGNYKFRKIIQKPL